MRFIVFVACALCLLAGCQSNVKTAANFCTEKSWYERGVEVGSQGGAAKLLDKYLERCKDAKTKENLREYQKGFIVGMKQYCTYNNGFALGASGDPLNTLCPAEFKEDFVAGYKMGKVKKREDQIFLDKAADDMWRKENHPKPAGPNTESSGGPQ